MMENCGKMVLVPKKRNGYFRSKICYTSLDSPIGTVFIASTSRGISAISLAITEDEFLCEIRKYWVPERDDKRFDELKKDLRNYFIGKKVDFGKYHLDISSGTEFQKKVWEKLLGIPYGETRSYKWLAEEVGSPKGFRAVGGANGKNPIPIIIPCHRVINSDGSLGGYSGGVWIKEWLLELEKRQVL
jgi:O-6-methylguanine DNA methyltransferase